MSESKGQPDGLRNEGADTLPSSIVAIVLASRVGDRPTRSLALGPLASRPASDVRRGAVVLELIVVLPLLMIGLLAVVEFGVWYSNLQRIEMAARAGAEVASELPPVSISLINGNPVPTAVVNAVERVLLAGNIQYREITLKHNLNMVPVTLETVAPGKNPCGDPVAPTLPTLGIYTRVTVCVQATELTPNLLKTFGFDIVNHVSQAHDTRRKEP